MQYSNNIQRTSSERNSQSRFPYLMTTLLGGCAVVIIQLPLLLLIGLFFYFEIYGLIFPGVFIGDTPVGKKTIEQAANEIDINWNSERQLVISDEEVVWTASANDLGFKLDPLSSAQAAYYIGRNTNGLKELLHLLSHQYYSVMPVVLCNQEVARLLLYQFAPVINQQSKEATVEFEQGEWRLIPGESGSELDVNETVDYIATHSSEIMMSGLIPLKMRRTTPIELDTSITIHILEGLFDTPFKIYAYDPINDVDTEWTVPQENIAPLIRIGNNYGNPEILINDDQFISYLETGYEQIGLDKTLKPITKIDDLVSKWQAGEPFEALVWNKPNEHIVVPGDNLVSISEAYEIPLWMIVDANPDLENNTVIIGQKIIIPSKNENLPLPVVKGKRIVISISQQKLRTFENRKLRNEYIISTGIYRSPTQTGVYQVQSHELNAYASVWDLYMPNFLGIYEAWPGFMNGIHGLPTLSNGQRLWENVLGRPASYGCIILTLEAAEDLYQWAEDGVVVEIDP